MGGSTEERLGRLKARLLALDLRMKALDLVPVKGDPRLQLIQGKVGQVFTGLCCGLWLWPIIVEKAHTGFPKAGGAA